MLKSHKNHSLTAGDRVITVAVASCFCCSAAVAADGTSSFSPYVSYTVGSDDNVLGLSNENQYLPLIGRSDGFDTTRTARGGIKGNYLVSRQRFDLTAELSKTQYSNLKALDYTGRVVQADWYWVVGNTLSGTVGTSDTQVVSTLSNFKQLTRNLRITKRTFANAGWMVTPSWRLLLNGSNYSLRYDLISQQFSNIDENNVESGISYVARSGSSIGLLVRRIDGKYPNRALFTGKDEKFQQSEIKANVDWLVSGKSRAQMLFGWTSRDSEGATFRQFSGPTARVTLTSATSGKTSVSASAWKEVAAVDDLLASYSINKGASLSPAWTVSEKFTLSADMRYEKRDIQGSSAVVTATTHSKELTSSLVATYALTRKTLVQASYYVFSRQGNAYGGSYMRHGTTLTAQYDF